MNALPLDADEIFVAVGYGGRRMMSADGKTWTITGEWAQPGGDDSNNLMSLVFANGRFVAVGGGGGGQTSGGHVLVSEDGRTWQETWAAPNRVNPIVFGNGRFLVGGPGKQLFVSADAETWVAGAKLDDRRATHFRQGAFGKGVFVITGNNGGQTPSWLTTTRDGQTVTEIQHQIPSIRGIAFGSERFVVVGEGVRSASDDGLTWTDTGVAADAKLTWIVHTGTEFLCGGGGQAFRSDDGLTWIADERRFRGNVVWSDGNRFITTSWPGKMAYSEDGGKTFESSPSLTDNGINRVARGESAQGEIARPKASP